MAGIPGLSQVVNTARTLVAQAPQSAQASSSPTEAPPDNPDSVMRATLSALHPDDVYGGANQGGIMKPLTRTNGVIFPYSPTISFSQTVQYMDVQLVHSNTDYLAYTRSPSVSLNVGGKFTVQNQAEGKYALAVIHFLRTVSKSYFGVRDADKAGLPPPVLLFSAYGTYMYNKLRVVLKSHNWSYDENMDTIAIKLDGGSSVRLPAVFTIQTELVVVQTPQRMRNEFSFDAFAKGDLLKDGGWI